MAAKVNLTPEQLAVLFESIDETKLTDEQKVVIDAARTATAETIKAEKVKKVLSGLNDRLLENVKLLKEKLSAIDIPDSVDIIRLPFDFNAVEKRFSRAHAIIPITSNVPYISPVIGKLVILMSGQSKPFQKTLTDMINLAGETQSENYVQSVLDDISFTKGAKTDIQSLYGSDQEIASFISDIDPDSLTEAEITSGKVELTYNSIAMVKQANPEDTDPKATWSITSADFSSKKAKVKSGNGKKSSAKDWIPDGYSAKTARAYVMERWGDTDEQLKKVKESGTDFNASQHLIRLEKTLDESERAYTNFKAKQTQEATTE